MATLEQPPTLSTPAVTNGRWAGYRNLLLARLKELWREPEIVFWVFGFPLLLALGLGIAFRNKPADVTQVAIVEGPQAQQVLALLHSSPEHAAFRAEVVSQQVAYDRFRLGVYALVVSMDVNGLHYRYDPARPESATARTQVDDALQAASGRTNPVASAATASSEPGARYIDFLIPGLLGMNLMNSGMWGVGFATVDMRQRKLLKRVVATPMRRTDFLLAIASSRLVLMLIEIVLLLGFGIAMFHLRVEGSWATIGLLGAIGAISFGALGLLSACRAQKIETASGLINLIMMPMWIFSGVFFSYERFPAMLQPAIKALPLTAINDALRAVILQGASLGSQWSRIAILAVWGGVSFVLALRWFRWS